MTRALLLLALITIASAQFTQNFTQILLGYGSQGVLVVPENKTDPDGNTYFALQKVASNQPDGQWLLNLIGADGSVTQLQNVNNNLVAISPDGQSQSLAASLPPLLGITGANLAATVASGVQSAVASVYADSNPSRISTTQASVQANTVINKLLASSTLPAFFLTPFKAQAANQILSSLRNAQKVSAAINASLIAQNPPPVVDNNTDTANNTDNTIPVTTANVTLNFSSFNLDSLEDVSQIAASYGDEGVVVRLDNETYAGEDNVSWLVNLQTLSGEEDNNEWALSWVDGEGNAFNVYDEDGRIVVVGPNNSTNEDWTTQAGWWTNAENGNVDEGVGNAIEDFVDQVFANANKTDTVVINVGEDGLQWSYPQANA